tara:strand:+ start:1427 stop:1666 length:240 start_codon:yes stop_codon:yes gene_type:complete
MSKVEIKWPNGKSTEVNSGTNWFDAAFEAGVSIPSGCLNGSCGACEIEVNGEVHRACISKVPDISSNYLEVDFSVDPYW